MPKLSPLKAKFMSFLRKMCFSIWYLRQPPWDTNITPPEVHEFIARHSPGHALDLGCGTGTNAITLAKHGWQVTGVDFVAKPIRMARQKARQAQVEVDFRVGDVTLLAGITGPFDLILDIGCYHSLSPKSMAAYRSKVSQLLKKGGSLMLYAFFREGEAESDHGVVEADLAAFSPRLNLIERQDGLERGSIASAWLTFRKDDE